MDRLTLHVVDSTSGPWLDAARELFVEYQRAIGVDLCFQGFAEELALLPGVYVVPSGRLYVGAVGGEPACCVALRRHDPESGEMKRLFVRSAFRGRGLGGALTRTILEDARQIGYRRVVLDTLPTMTDAQRMYEALGFADIPPYTTNPVPGARFMGVSLHR